MQVDWGDEERVVQRDEKGNPNRLGQSSMMYLTHMGDTWMRPEDAAHVQTWGADQKPEFLFDDLRRIGVAPVQHWNELPDMLQKNGMPPLEYAVSAEQSLVVVTAQSADSAFRWWIDPDQGHNIVKTAVFVDGRQIGETEVSLQRKDGIWFPRRVVTYRMGNGERRESAPKQVIDVISAEFNRPEHSKKLGPEHIGVEPGMNIFGQWRHRKDSDKPVRLVWDGHGLAEHDEYLERVERGEAEFGPTVRREMVRAIAIHERRMRLQDFQATSRPAGTQPVATTQPSWRGFESMWEKYTREFISTYKLDEEQTQRAWMILRGCQDVATRHVLRYHDELDRLSKAHVAPQDATSRNEHEKRLQELLRPIDDLFEQRLKPRLEKLPTASQRKAAASQPVTR